MTKFTPIIPHIFTSSSSYKYKNRVLLLWWQFFCSSNGINKFMQLRKEGKMDRVYSTYGREEECI
jgi:hypothetical protein